MHPSDKTRKNPLPHGASDHDDRDEMPSSDKLWLEDELPRDAAMASEKHAEEFHKDGVPLSSDDWDKEEEEDDEIPDHIDKVVDDSLEALAEKEMAGEEEEESE